MNKENLLIKFFLGRIIVPIQVYKELSHPSVPHIGDKMTRMKADNEVEIKDIIVGSEEYRLYIEMTLRPDLGVKPIGDREAAALAHAKVLHNIILHQ